MCDIVKRFFDEKLTTFSLKHKSKKPPPEGWRALTAGDNDIENFNKLPANVGIVLGDVSGGLVDIDLDRLSAVKVAPYFLPATGWVFGRKSKPNSHWVYRVPEAGQKVKYECRYLVGKNNEPKGVFVEYRGNGCYTVFPPSAHEDPPHEQIEFSQFDGIGKSTREELLIACQWIFATAVLAECYKEGSRQDVIMALTGTLLHGGKSITEIKNMVAAICDATGDREYNQRVGAMNSTHLKWQRGERVTQWGSLVGLIGEEPVKAVADVLGLKKGSAEPTTQIEDEKNDTGVAASFVKSCARNQLLYIPMREKFFVYEDGLWHEDDGDVKTERLFDRFIMADIRSLRTDPNIPAKVMNSEVAFLLKYRNDSNIKKTIRRVRTLLDVPPNLLDANNDLIGVRNGVYNMRTGTLEEPKPEHYITQRSNVMFDAKAKCPKFKAFLHMIFEGDEELIHYIQAIMGYMLTGHVDRQEFYIFWGEGQNGKSTLINFIRHMLGSLATGLMDSTLFENTGANAEYDIASCSGKRLVIGDEMESGSRLNARMLKRLTGDKIKKTRDIYEKAFDFDVRFKLVIICNKKPRIDVYDEAIKRRVRFIPFNYRIPDEMRVLDFDGKLLAEEASGILNFMLEGAKVYMAGQIVEPKTLTRATKGYFKGQDSVDEFIEFGGIARNPDLSVGIGVFYDRYREYCEDAGLDTLGKKELTAILLKLGYTQDRTASKRVWKGLGLADVARSAQAFQSFTASNPKLKKLLGVEAAMTNDKSPPCFHKV